MTIDPAERPSLQQLANGGAAAAATDVPIAEQVSEHEHRRGVRCPQCGRVGMKPLGFRMNKSGVNRALYHCKGEGACGFAGEVPFEEVLASRATPEPKYDEPTPRQIMQSHQPSASPPPVSGRRGRPPKAKPAEASSDLPPGIVLSEEGGAE